VLIVDAVLSFSSSELSCSSWTLTPRYQKRTWDDAEVPKLTWDNAKVSKLTWDNAKASPGTTRTCNDTPATTRRQVRKDAKVSKLTETTRDDAEVSKLI
jgi:hypothetical protein